MVLYKHPAVNNSCFKKNVSYIADCLLKTYDDLLLWGMKIAAPQKALRHRTFLTRTGSLILLTSPHDTKIPYPINIISIATKSFAPSQKPRKISCRNFNHFNDYDVLYDMSSAPFHVAEVDDMAWYTSTLITDVVDFHVPIKSKFVKCKPVLYMIIPVYAKPCMPDICPEWV